MACDNVNNLDTGDLQADYNGVRVVSALDIMTSDG